MNIEIKVDILPWNEFKFEYKFEGAGERDFKVLEGPQVSLEPTSEPYIPPPSVTVGENISI